MSEYLIQNNKVMVATGANTGAIKFSGDKEDCISWIALHGRLYEPQSCSVCGEFNVNKFSSYCDCEDR